MKLTRVTSDDWEGLYLDNKLIAQNHSVDTYYALMVALKTTNPLVIDIIDLQLVDEDWIESVGRFPDNLEDIPKV